MEKWLLPFGGKESDLGMIPKIMIVDDDESHLQFIKLILLRESMTCELILYSNAPEALEYLRKTEVDLVLLDLMMPEMDGFEMMDALKGRESTAGIPVIFLTSTQDTDYVVRAFEHGAVDYIAKPINSAILTARVLAVLQRKYLENELKLRNQELERINRFKDELLSVCSHDLRSPLAAIEVICHSLKADMGENSPPAGKGPVDRIVKQSRLARRLVENFLDYNKIEEGMLVPSPTLFMARELLTACVEDEQPLIFAGELELELTLPDEETIVFGDRELLAQAVRNVLGNAIKFAKGRIALTGGLRQAEAERGGHLVITVTDDGPGIKPELIGKVFEKYSKQDPGASGTGLGLYITKVAVELHGGTISADSKPGEVTSFTISIPHAFRRERLPDLSEFAETEVLIVSGSKTTALLLESLLQEGGMLRVGSVTTEKTPEEAVLADPPRLVVADLNSAGLNLFHMAKIINKAQPSLRWIFYGSTSEVESFSKLVNVPYAHLETPFNPLVYLNLFASLAGESYPENATVVG